MVLERAVVQARPEGGVEGGPGRGWAGGAVSPLARRSRPRGGPGAGSGARAGRAFLGGTWLVGGRLGPGGKLQSEARPTDRSPLHLGTAGDRRVLDQGRRHGGR